VVVDPLYDALVRREERGNVLCLGSLCELGHVKYCKVGFRV
jgi:hypothetical protein